jgi:hypothetical protein
MRIGKMMVAAGVAGLLWGCESVSSTTSSDDLVYTVSPNPAVAVPSAGVTYTIPADDYHADRVIDYPWKTSFTVTMQETEGVGRDINSVSVSVQQAQGGVVLTPSGSDKERFQYTSNQADGSRLEANGTFRMAFDVWYDLPNKGNSALVTLVFSFTDDDDYALTEIVKVPVQ